MTGPAPSAPALPPPSAVTQFSADAATVERTRSMTGLFAVVAGDVAIGVAAGLAILEVTADAGSSSAVVSILTSAFTAIGTMTTAYFGIKAASNTAQSAQRVRADAGPAGPTGTTAPNP